MTTESDGGRDLVIRLEHDVSWSDVAPLLDELQAPDNQAAVFIRVERVSTRVAAGGPGLGIMPVAVAITLGPLIAEFVKDVVYPKLKDRVLALYRLVAEKPRAMEVAPISIDFYTDDLSAIYRFPYGLNEGQFDRALSTVPVHYASIKSTRRGVALYEFDASSDAWTELEEASKFLNSTRASHGVGRRSRE